MFKELQGGLGGQSDAAEAGRRSRRVQGRADSGVYWSGTETHWLLVDTGAMRCDLALTGSPGPGQKPGDLTGGLLESSL